MVKVDIALNEFIKTSSLVDRFANGLKTVFSGLGVVISAIGYAFLNLGSVVGQAMSIFSKADFTEGALKEDSVIIKALFAIREAFASVFGFIGSLDFSGLMGGIGSFFEGFGNTLVWIKDKVVGVVEFFGNLPKLIGDNQGWILAGGGIASMAALIWKAYEIFRDITKPFSKFSDLLDAGSDAIENLGGVFEAASGSLKAFTIGIHVKSLLTIALAVGVLALSLKLLSDLNATQISTGLYMIVGSLAALVGALTIMSKFDVTGSFGATLSIVALSVAIGALAVAVKYLSDMKYEEMTRGIIGLVAILGTLTGAIVLMSKFGSSFAVGAMQFLAIAAAIHILISAMDQISGLKPESINKSLVVLGIVLAQLGLFIKLASSRSATFTASAAGILATAGAVWIIVKAMESLAELKPSELVKGLAGVGTVLALIAGFSVVAGKSNMLVTGAGLLLIAGALNALVIPISILGNMTLETLAKGLGAIGLAMAALAITSKLMTGTIPAAIALTLLAVAMNLMIIPIAALGAMSWAAILTGIGGLTLALLAIGGVAILLGAATLPMLGFGVAILAIGAGFALLGKGILILTTTTVASVTVILTAMAALITGVVTLLPAITDLLMKVTNAIVEVAVKMAPKIADAVGRLMVAVLSKVKEYVPQLVELLLQTLELVLMKLGEYIPKFLDIIVTLLVTVLEKFAGFVDDVVRVVLDLILALLSTIEEYIPKFVKASTDIILAFLKGLTDNIPLIISAVSEFMVTLVTSMADTIDKNGPIFIDSIMRLMGEVVELIVTAGLSVIEALFSWIPGVSAVTEEIGKTAGKYIEDNFKAYDIGNEKGGEFADALSGTDGQAKSAGVNIAKAGVSGAGSVDAGSTGENFGIGFANGISTSSVLKNVISSAKSLASAAYNTIVDMLDIHSPARETHQLGEHTGDGFANGIASKGKSVVEALFGWMPGMKDAGNTIKKTAATGGEQVGTSAVSGISKGLKKAAPKATASAKKAVKKTAKDVAGDAMKAFKEKMDELEYKFEMGEIDHAKQLKGVESLKKAYAKYPEIVKEASKKIKKIEDDMIKDRQEKEDKVHSKRKALIDERKYYNEISLKQELEAWERMQTRHAEGTEKRKEADREVYRLKKEIHSKMVSLNDEYFDKVQETNQKLIDDELALNDKYNSALSDRTKSIRDGMGSLFEEFAAKNEVSGKKLMDNLRSQVNGIMQWSQSLRALETKGISAGLLAELREMGPKAASEIAALNTLTHLELQEYSGLWSAANALASTEAIGELQGMKEDTVKQIEELRKEAKSQLELYKDEWLTKLKEIRTGVPDQFDGLDASMESIGRDAMKGFQQGLAKMKGPLVTEAKNIANAVDATIRKTLKIKSPSRVLMADGVNAGKGLAIGLHNSGKAVIASARDMAMKASNTIRSLLDDVLSSEEGKELRIKATLDYDGSGLSELAKMRANTVVPDLSATRALSSSIRPIPQVRQETQQTQPKDPGVKEELGGLVSSINSLLDNPQPIQLFVDGHMMTEVVSRHQYSNRMIGAMAKGV